MTKEELQELVKLAVGFSRQHEELTPAQQVKLFKDLLKTYLEETKK